MCGYGGNERRKGAYQAKDEAGSRQEHGCDDQVMADSTSPSPSLEKEVYRRPKSIYKKENGAQILAGKTKVERQQVAAAPERFPGSLHPTLIYSCCHAGPQNRALPHHGDPRTDIFRPFYMAVTRGCVIHSAARPLQFPRNSGFVSSRHGTRFVAHSTVSQRSLITQGSTMSMLRGRCRAELRRASAGVERTLKRRCVGICKANHFCLAALGSPSTRLVVCRLESGQF
jgi:hypothetical protein